MSKIKESTRTFGKHEYPVTIEKVGELKVINHSALFSILPPTEVRTYKKRNRVDATFNYASGTLSRVEYAVGKVGLIAQVIRAIGEEVSSPYFEIAANARISPLDLMGIGLQCQPYGEAGQTWECVDWPRNIDRGTIRLPRLTPRVAQRLERDGDPQLQNMNMADMSVSAQDVNGKNGASLPEIVFVGGLENAAVSKTVSEFLRLTVHNDLLPYLELIQERESEIFPA